MFRWLFLAFLPILVIWLASTIRSNPKQLPKACFALGFLPFFLSKHLYVAPYHWLGWYGPAKGFEISILDGIALAIILATRRIATPMPMIIGFGVYLIAQLVATTQAFQPIPASFYVWQVLRVALIFVAVSRATAASEDAAIGIASGLGAAVVVQAIACVSQFAQGAIQATGTMGHQNELGVLANFAVMPAFAMLLAHRRDKMAGIIVAAGAIVAVTGASRATLALFGGGLLLTALLSLRYRNTPRKIAFTAAGVLTLMAAVPLVMWAIDRRSEEARLSSNEQRAAMIRAADMIIAEHPLGVGPNSYVFAAIKGGYSERAGVAWSSDIRGQPVHNSYALITAESGYLGLAGVIIIFGSFLILGLRSLIPSRIDDQAGLCAGMFVAIIVGLVHARFEWISITYACEAVMVMGIGAVTGRIAARKKQSAKSKARRKRPAMMIEEPAQPSAPSPA